MKFLVLVDFLPDAFANATPEDHRRLDDATIAHDRKLRDSGHLLIASPLQDPSTTVTIDRRQGVSLDHIDGPYAEAKEVIGGFLLIEARDMDEAKALFDDDPISRYGRLQIRPLLEDHKHSETGESRPDFKAL